jgi:hypothetical protein
MTSRGRIFLILAALATSSTALAEGGANHLGVATCAPSVCHGKVAPQPGGNIGQNEYRIWTQDDGHAHAYRALEQPLSKRIAASLGLGNPTSEKVCLDCHTDNMPKDRRGPRFQLSDGVACEACHGGAGTWIENHYAEGRQHRQNVSEGMYPSDQPPQRAQLCLSCHLGTKDKFATHLMMAAGHPRLSFELEAYTTNQPPHYTVDADYKQRKGKIEGVNLWLAGQIESARSLLLLQQSDRFRSPGMFPELALYDCHSCHHPMDQPRWTAQRATAGTRPGTLRLQTQNLVMLQLLLGKVEPSAGVELASLTSALVKAGQQDADSVKTAAGTLLAWLKTREPLSRRPFSQAEVQSVRKTLVGHAAADKVADYAVAEQIVLGVESLSYSIGDRSGKKGALDRLYETVKSGTSFNPTQFASAARAVLGQF